MILVRIDAAFVILSIAKDLIASSCTLILASGDEVLRGAQDDGAASPEKAS